MSGTYRLRPEVIDLARKRTGCTSDEKLAEHLKISSGTIYRIRRGETPSFANGIRLLDAAGVSLGGVQKSGDKAAA